MKWYISVGVGVGCYLKIFYINFRNMEMEVITLSSDEDIDTMNITFGRRVE